MKKLFLAGFFTLLLSACQTNSFTTTDTDFNHLTNKSESTSSAYNASQGTMKYISRVDLASKMCKVAGNGYKDYLVLSNTNVEFLPIVIQDGQYINLPETAKIRFSNVVNRPNAAPFNMGTCVEDIMKTGIERFFTGFFKDVFQLGRDIAPYGAGYLIADKLFDHLDKSSDRLAENAGNKIENVGDGATVAVGTDDAAVSVDNRSDQAGDNSTYNTCAGELSEDGTCVLPVESAEASTSTTETTTEEDSDGLFGLQSDGTFAGSGSTICTPSEASENGGDCPQE